MYLVVKSFGVASVEAGEVVDGKNYKLLAKLIARRYLTELDKKVKPVKCQLCGRQFQDEKTLETHYLTQHPNEVEVTSDVDETKKGV